MIQPQELRIGNYIYLHPKGGHQELGCVAGIAREEIYFKCGDSCLTEESEPIPITEDWLIRVGFSMEENVAPTWNHKSGVYFYDKYGTEFYGITIMGNVEIKMQYVHQLQNLYWILCGEELTININN